LQVTQCNMWRVQKKKRKKTQNKKSKGVYILQLNGIL
jgi:hypothetical protein